MWRTIAVCVSGWAASAWNASLRCGTVAPSAAMVGASPPPRGWVPAPCACDQWVQDGAPVDRPGVTLRLAEAGEHGGQAQPLPAETDEASAYPILSGMSRPRYA